MSSITLHDVFAYGFAVLLGLAIAWALYAVLSLMLAWWLALICAFVVQHFSVHAFEAARPGQIDVLCNTVASSAVVGVRAAVGMFKRFTA